MADLKQAVELITDPANVAEINHPGEGRRFAVNQKKVLRGLRSAGAGKAEARELALKAIAEAGGGVEERTGRGGAVAGGRLDSSLEEWWVPFESVRFEQD